MSYYVCKDAPVFSAFLVDRTNHNLLFAKLIRCNGCTYVHSKTVVELVQATDHASKIGCRLFIHLTFNKWGKAKGDSELILVCCLPG